MAEETTGAGPSEKSAPAEGTPGSATATVAEDERYEAASKLVDRFSLWSGAAGLIPVPLVDIVAVGGVQLEMLRRLSEIYNVPFSDNRAQGDPGSRNSDCGVYDAGVLCLRHLRDRKGLHPAFRFRWHVARLQSSRLSRVHQDAKGEMDLPVRGVPGCPIRLGCAKRVNEQGRGRPVISIGSDPSPGSLAPPSRSGAGAGELA
jgi:Domain of unknown function (DUF697)